MTTADVAACDTFVALPHDSFWIWWLLLKIAVISLVFWWCIKEWLGTEVLAFLTLTIVAQSLQHTQSCVTYIFHALIVLLIVDEWVDGVLSLLSQDHYGTEKNKSVKSALNADSFPLWNKAPVVWCCSINTAAVIMYSCKIESSAPSKKLLLMNWYRQLDYSIGNNYLCRLIGEASLDVPTIQAHWWNKDNTEKQRNEIKGLPAWRKISEWVVFVQRDKLRDSCFMLFKNSYASWLIQIWFPGNRQWL